MESLAKLVRYYILISTTEAGSGHPTSSLSAADLMVVLMFGGFFKADLDNPENPNNDRLIFSKGHASPLLYSLYAAAGKVTEKELKTLRKFGSKLEGHPTMEFAFTEAATGSLGQGLSIGLGMALNAKLDKLNYRTFVLMGDSEIAEGSIWESIALASHYKTGNLVGIIDVNRLGQRGETLLGHDLKTYQKRIGAFGWKTWVVDGHDIPVVRKTLKLVQDDKSGLPKMIIAKTLKGKGVSFLEDKDGWHGKALGREELVKALDELGEVDKNTRGEVASPSVIARSKATSQSGLNQDRNSASWRIAMTNYKLGDMVATRKAYGTALVKLVKQNPNIVVLDSEVSNSTMSEYVKKEFPERFFEMFIAEQNMVGAALGLSRRGKLVFVSTFAAFFSRAFDQIRMSQYSNPNIKFVGSHAGVSIGEDGFSQMGLEDIAMFRTLLNGVVLYPSDGVSTEKLMAIAALYKGNVYIRTTRADTPVIYTNNEDFKVGGLKIHKIKDERSMIKDSKVFVIAAGITLHEALKAQKELEEQGIGIDVADLYSVKPLDTRTITKLSKESDAIITVEDHFAEGGIGEAVRSALKDVNIQIHSLAVRKMPKSGKPDELLSYEEIDSQSIIKKVKELL